METRFYSSKDINIQSIAHDVERAYNAMGYQVQVLGDDGQAIIQLRKGSDLEAWVGLQAALTVTIQRASNGTMVMLGQQKWIDKAAAGVAGIAIPILWPLALTSGLGVVRQVKLGNEVLSMIDQIIQQQTRVS